MKILSVSVQNMGSYKDLTLSFDPQGLILVQGPTGSGKSTLCDTIPWVLFGKTAKNGSVDEIRSWGCSEPTVGTIFFEDGLEIRRIRGAKAKDNDLYFCMNNGTMGIQRGKDIPDTQRLINNLLGFDCDLYLAAAYFHEFSQTAQFFTTSAKNRRTICEQIVDLSLAKNLHVNISNKVKITKTLLEQTIRSMQEQDFKLTELIKLQKIENTRVATWEIKQEELINHNEAKALSFENTKASKIAQLKQKRDLDLANKNLSTKCSECGAIKKLSHSHTATSQYDDLIVREEALENPFITRLAELQIETNPFEASNSDYFAEIAAFKAAVLLLDVEQSSLKMNLADLDLLSEVVEKYRSVSINNTINIVESSTNKLLTEHFDAEIRVEFIVEAADKLEVVITKDGNLCSYTQLSKGQRQLLKLCFGLSIMTAVQNHHGITLSSIFLDEALDGLDEQMKIKAFHLLETIAVNYENVFVVEHSEQIKPLFNSVYSVQLVNGNSVIEKAS